MSSRNEKWLLLWWQERARDSQRHSRQADCHLCFAWDFRPHPLCAGDRVQQPSSSQQKWNPAEEKHENTGLKETAKTPNLSQQPELIVNAGKVKLRHRLQQPGFAHCLFSSVPPDALPPPCDLHLEEAFVPSSEWFPFVPTLSALCPLLPSITDAIFCFAFMPWGRHCPADTVRSISEWSLLSRLQSHLDFLLKRLDMVLGKIFITSDRGKKSWMHYHLPRWVSDIFFPCQLQSKAKKPRWQTIRVEDEDAHLQRGVVKGNRVQTTATKNKIN